MVSIVSFSSKKDPKLQKVQNTFCWNQTLYKFHIASNNLSFKRDITYTTLIDVVLSIFLCALPLCLVSRASRTQNNCPFCFLLPLFVCFKGKLFILPDWLVGTCSSSAFKLQRSCWVPKLCGLCRTSLSLGQLLEQFLGRILDLFLMRSFGDFFGCFFGRLLLQLLGQLLAVSCGIFGVNQPKELRRIILTLIKECFMLQISRHI